MGILNVKLGVCTVVFGGTDLGHTIGGVEVTYSPEYHETKVDKYNAVSERWLVGEKWSAKVPLAENTIANIGVAIPHATIAAPNRYATMGKTAGQRTSTLAQKLVLHPIGLASSDHSGDVILYKAHVNSELTIAYKNDGEQILEVVFEAIVDETKNDGAYLGMVGDSL